MKNFRWMIACLTVVLGAGLAHPVYADDTQKQTYETAKLSEDVHTAGIDDRAQRLQLYLQSTNSPLSDSAGHFVKEADRLGLDWKLVAAIAGNESYFGQLIPEDSYNGWGWAVYTGMSYGAAFANWQEGITVVSEGLKTDYIDQGFVTVDQIGTKYAADPQWSVKVRHFMEEIATFKPYEADVKQLALSI